MIPFMERYKVFHKEIFSNFKKESCGSKYQGTEEKRCRYGYKGFEEGV